MIDILNMYLIQHKSINIPGLGTIFIEHLPATSDVGNQRILPPHFEFRFNKYFDTPDKEFFSYLSYQKGIADFEAIQLYNQFAQDFHTAIKQEDRAEWQDVGVFVKNSAGDLVFEPIQQTEMLYAPVPAVRIVRERAAHAVLVGDQEKTTVEMTSFLNDEKVEKPVVAARKWWLYAVILLIIATLVLFFLFYQKGFNITAAANRQTVALHPANSR